MLLFKALYNLQHPWQLKHPEHNHIFITSLKDYGFTEISPHEKQTTVVKINSFSFSFSKPLQKCLLSSDYIIANKTDAPTFFNKFGKIIEAQILPKNYYQTKIAE